MMNTTHHTIHVEYSGNKAMFDFQGNILKGNLSSKTATKLVREWIDLHTLELENDWKLAMQNKVINKIEPLK
ncbi:putative ORF-2 [uncultured Candidatus Thioglobus sp.]|nr:putative ORF-2 [uncultured Candidatus Thioglobus sp.]